MLTDSKVISTLTRELLVLLSISISLCIGQVPTQQPPAPPATRIGDHQIGETFGAWIAVNAGVPAADALSASAGAFKKLEDVCKPFVRAHPWKQEGLDRKAECRALFLIRDTGSGEFQAAVAGQPVTWHFIASVVAEARIEHALPNTTLEMAHLTEAYGPATTNKTAEFQNAYGARWDCLEASWNMPDGSFIRLAESIKNLSSGPTRWLTITFYSKERINSLVGGNDKTNPFLSPTAKPQEPHK